MKIIQQKILFIAKKISGIIYIKILTFELIGFLKKWTLLFSNGRINAFRVQFPTIVRAELAEELS